MTFFACLRADGLSISLTPQPGNAAGIFFPHYDFLIQVL
jgi:hypothetical protein